MQSVKGSKGVSLRPAPQHGAQCSTPLPGRAGQSASSFTGQSIWTRYDLLGETCVRGPPAACAACQTYQTALAGRPLPKMRTINSTSC